MNNPAELDLSVLVGQANTDLLCYAWGETDFPAACIVHDRNELVAFIVSQWLGDTDAIDADREPELPKIMQQIREHDWDEEQEISWEFEIGGVRMQRVFDAAPTLLAEVVRLRQRVVAELEKGNG